MAVFSQLWRGCKSNPEETDGRDAAKAHEAMKAVVKNIAFIFQAIEVRDVRKEI